MSAARSGAVVLAAGAGRRFEPLEGGAHKLLAPFRGRPVVWWAVSAAAGAGMERTWVIQGAVDLDAAGALPPEVEVIVNPRWAEGQATSLQRGLAAAREAGLEAVVVGLGDQPLVPTEAWRSVAAASGLIAVATYDGRRRNPVRLAREVWDLLPMSGDEGARVLIKDRPDLVQEVPCQGEPTDIDTQEDLQRWS